MLRKIDLNMYLPQVIGDAKEIKAIMDSENIEFNKIWQVMERVHNNQFILTADEKTLSWYEKVLLITPRGDLEKRRKKVLIEWNRKVLYTDRSLREILDELIGVNGYYLDLDYDGYKVYFTIKITVTGVNYDELYDYLRVTIPANLLIEFGVLSEHSMSIITEHEYNWYRYFMCGQHKCGTIPRYATKYETIADNVMEINVESEERQYNLPMTGLVKTGQKNPAFAMRTQTKVRVDSGKYGPTELVINVADGGTYGNIDLGKVGD